MTTNYKSIILAARLFLAFSVSVSAAPGDLDPTFGNGGIVIGNYPGNLNIVSDMAIQPGGKIVVVSSSTDRETMNVDFAVVRYNPNSSLDTTFGGTGIVTTPVGFFTDSANAVAIQSDGKIVAAGYSINDSNNFYDMSLVRYNPDGSLDTSFNGTGKIITPVGSSSSSAESVAIQTDGKIVVVGISRNALDYEDFTVVRYNPNGSLDTTFNGTGKVTTPIGLFDFARSVAVQTDGRIVVAGHVSDGTTLYFGLVRYNPNGSLDTSFGGTGKVMTLVGNSDSEGKEAAIQSDGKIVVAGHSAQGFGIVRYNTDGSLDNSFGGTGKIIIPIGSGGSASSVAVQTDGKIVAAGWTNHGGMPDPLDFALVRYQGGSNANIRTRFDFDGDGRADVSVFRPTDRTWYLNQSTNGFSAAQFGLSTDKLTPADFDGDGKTDIAVFRDGNWYLLRSTAGFASVQFGATGDIPTPADFSGDGRAELAVYRGGVWWTLNLTNNQVNSLQFGAVTDKPVVADYDGDGRADHAVYRNGEWHLNRSSQGYTAVQFGTATDTPTVGDFDGDGKGDPAVYRAGVWYVLGSTQGFYAVQFGIASDVPVAADYDGDGKTDIAVFRNGNWYLLRSQQGFGAIQFGAADDKPIPAAFAP